MEGDAERSPVGGSATWVLAIGIVGAATFLALYLMGLATPVTFGAAFGAGLVLEVAKTARPGPVTIGRGAAVLLSLAISALLSVAAVTAGRPATDSAVAASYVLGFVSGSFVTDGLLRKIGGV